jgi:hypothetical protein
VVQFAVIISWEIQVAKHPEKQSAMKQVYHIYHWIYHQVEQRQITVSHVPGDENPVDIFTKPDMFTN